MRTPAEGFPAVPADGDPFRGQLGLHSTFSYLRQVTINELTVGIAQSMWLSQVLPGLGIDNLRLVELAFPPGLRDIGNAAVAFDSAQRAYQQRRYEDSWTSAGASSLAGEITLAPARTGT